MAFVHPSRLAMINSSAAAAVAAVNRSNGDAVSARGGAGHTRRAIVEDDGGASDATLRSHVPLPDQSAQFARNAPSSASQGRPQRSSRDTGPPPPVHAVLPGVVHSVQSFGAFVAMDGFGKHGLVHISQLCDRRVEQASEVVVEGQRVFVKVLSVADGKCSLSMKLADQQSGRDLDPGHDDAVRFAENGGSRGPSRPAPLELGAVINTTCTRCGRHGHLSNECFTSRTEDAKYDLIMSDDENVRKVEAQMQQVATLNEEKRIRHVMREARRAARAEKRERSKSSSRHKHSRHRRRRHKSKSKKSASSSSSSSLSSSSSRSYSSYSSSSRSRSRHRRRRSRSPRSSRRRSRSPKRERRRSHSRDRDERR